MKPRIEVKDLQVTLQSQGQTIQAVRNVSFTLYEGERLGIVGESGCGKTMLMKSLLQLLPSTATIDSGEIWYQGTNLVTLSEKKLQCIRGKEIGMIFQDPMTSLNPTLKIGTQIAEGLLRHFPKITKNQAKQRALELLKQVGIPEPELRLEQYPHLLSGGIRQRAVIALALASKPSILIADEPTTALDVTVQAQTLDLLLKLQQGTSILLITHDLSIVASFCDRVLVMYAGQIVEEASVEELFAHPQHPYTQRLLKSIPRQGEQLHPIAGSPPDLSIPLQGCAFCNRCTEAMNICRTETPPLFNERARCWLLDSRRNR
ncbi:MAG TPA: ABC transporter ATP-binding protein [Rhabdochlamydiaceae bacterium]|nr:ABC transporter ATP-binding protein [Rhabdochlamydiaceae bacterium]